MASCRSTRFQHGRAPLSSPRGGTRGNGAGESRAALSGRTSCECDNVGCLKLGTVHVGRDPHTGTLGVSPFPSLYCSNKMAGDLQQKLDLDRSPPCWTLVREGVSGFGSCKIHSFERVEAFMCSEPKLTFQEKSECAVRYLEHRWDAGPRGS